MDPTTAVVAAAAAVAVVAAGDGVVVDAFAFAVGVVEAGVAVGIVAVGVGAVADVVVDGQYPGYGAACFHFGHQVLLELDHGGGMKSELDPN